MDAGGRFSLTVSVVDFVSENFGIIVFLIMLISFSAYFSGAETAISASNKIKLKSEADSGDRRAKTMMKLSDSFDRTLTTVLFGNDLVNIATASVTTVLALRLGIPETVMTLCVTAVVILFGEVMPKTVVKERVDSFALTYAPSLKFICTLLKPFAVIFSVFSAAVGKLFAPESEPSVTEDDVRDIIEDIDESGAAEKDEVNLLYSAFEFDDVTVGDIYTSYENVVAVNIDKYDPDSLIRLIRDNMYSRMPVYRENKDCVIGILRVRTFLEAHIFENKSDISDMLDTPITALPSTPADELLRLMQSEKIHMAIVKSEDGRTLGVITLEDLLEELVGEIFDESDVVEDKFRKLSEDKYEVSSDISVISAFELMEFDGFDRDECGHETLLMWANTLAGKKLRRGDSVSYGALRLTAGRSRHGKPDKFYIDVSAALKEEAEK